MTKDEIILELTELGAQFSKRDSRAKLAELLESLNIKTPAKPEPLEGEFLPFEDDDKRYLKNGRTGFVFEATPALLRADDLLPATEAEYRAFKGIK